MGHQAVAAESPGDPLLQACAGSGEAQCPATVSMTGGPELTRFCVLLLILVQHPSQDNLAYITGRLGVFSSFSTLSFMSSSLRPRPPPPILPPFVSTHSWGLDLNPCLCWASALLPGSISSFRDGFCFVLLVNEHSSCLDIAQLEKCFPGRHQALDSTPTSHKLDVVAQARNLSTREEEARDQKLKVTFKSNVVLNYTEKLAWAT